MTISGAGGLRVPSPPCREPLLGLKSVAEVVEKTGDEWARGLEWDELPCGYTPVAVSGPCPDLPEHLKVPARGKGYSDSAAFVLYAGWECSTGGLPISEAWDNAEELLRRGWWKGIEAAFWGGVDQDGNPIDSSLRQADAEDVTPSGGATDLVSSVAALEDFAAECMDCEPIIHVRPGVATHLARWGLVELADGVLRMKGTGTLVSPGRGYGTVGPDGSEPSAGEVWLYVTGGVRVTHGATFFTPDRGDEAGAVDRLVNNVTVYAERFVALQLGCCVGAVRADLES